MGNIKVGTVTGTGVAINISLGFIPDYVRIVNVTDGDTIHEWFYGMGAADAIKAINVVDSGSSGAAGLSLITSAGIDAYVGDSSNAKGFTISSTISEADKVLRYVAIASGAGLGS